MNSCGPRLVLCVVACLVALLSPAQASPAQTNDGPLDLSPIARDQWSRQHARHLFSRAAFGATSVELDRIQHRSPAQVVKRLLRGWPSKQAEFEHSGVFQAGLDPFPSSRPATTALAKREGQALGIATKAGGDRPLQPIVNQFFYWLRASRLETDRVAYWWANRMLTTRHPLQEKMALFWHGHFATNEDKVRDYRKMLQQLQLFQAQGLGSFRELLIGVAQDPAMLVFLDAGVNTKDSPNENFAREIMELFTMGVGRYGERDVQEAARAFTGWNVDGLDFTIRADDQDLGEKRFLGESGYLDGVDIIDRILRQPGTAEFIATKLYRYFVNEEVGAAAQRQLGALLLDNNYRIDRFLQELFLSNDFYHSRNRGSRIKSPVELMVSTYKQLGLDAVPGVPDFNVVGEALGQRLMHPPTVAGWSQGRSWITPSLLFERSNFVLDVLFPDIGFVPPDRYPSYTAEIVNVQRRLRQGQSISAATRPSGVEDDAKTLAASNLLADRDEDFNTRLGSMRGWQMALERVKPIERSPARLNLTADVLRADLATPIAVVDYFVERFFVVELSAETKTQLANALAQELGTEDVMAASSYLEEPLRKLLHQLLSLPEYQLG